MLSITLIISISNVRMAVSLDDGFMSMLTVIKKIPVATSFAPHYRIIPPPSFRRPFIKVEGEYDFTVDNRRWNAPFTQLVVVVENRVLNLLYCLLFVLFDECVSDADGIWAQFNEL